MAEERTYIIPLRREWLKAPKYKRAKKAVTAVREFVIHHMRNENVLIGPKLNLKIWEHGIKNPPAKVKVTCYEDKEGIVRAELFGFEFKPKEKKETKQKASGLMGKVQDKLGPKEEEVKTEATTKKDIKEVKKGVDVKPEEPKTEAPVEEKSEEKKEDAPAERPAEEKPAEPAPKAPEEKKEEVEPAPAEEKKE